MKGKKFDMKFNHNSLFVFRRDLRIEDNSGLIRALNESEEVIISPGTSRKMLDFFGKPRNESICTEFISFKFRITFKFTF